MGLLASGITDFAGPQRYM